jgi:hypothetical protein
MNLEVRISSERAEVHLIDPSNNHPLSIIKSDLDGLNSLIIYLRSRYAIKSVKRNKKPLLTN